MSGDPPPGPPGAGLQVTRIAGVQRVPGRGAESLRLPSDPNTWPPQGTRRVPPSAAAAGRSLPPPCPRSRPGPSAGADAAPVPGAPGGPPAASPGPQAAAPERRRSLEPRPPRSCRRTNSPRRVPTATHADPSAPGLRAPGSGPHGPALPGAEPPAGRHVAAAGGSPIDRGRQRGAGTAEGGTVLFLGRTDTGFAGQPAPHVTGLTARPSARSGH